MTRKGNMAGMTEPAQRINASVTALRITAASHKNQSRMPQKRMHSGSRVILIK